jgi:hypothetical protein
VATRGGQLGISSLRGRVLGSLKSVSATPRPFVRIERGQPFGLIRGRTVAGAEIEATNLSVSWMVRVRPNQPVVIARGDASGRFEGRLPLKPNDVVRIRARAPSGKVGKWRVFRARLSGTPRRPGLAVSVLGLRALADGSIKIFSLDPWRPIAEPRTRFVLTNERTGARIAIVTGPTGLLKGRLKIAGRAGDVLRAQTANGRVLGRITTPTAKPDGDVVRPSAIHQKLGFVPGLRRFRAPLFARRPRPFEVYQSELQNCYVASAAAALAHVRPSALARAIRPLGDGAYRIRFKTFDPRTERYAPVDVKVTSELWVRPSGELLYGTTSRLGAPLTLWWPLLEKAYARLKGSYKRIGRGGCSHHVMELLLGRPRRHFFVASTEPETVWREMTAALAARLPVVSGTYPAQRWKNYRDTGLYPDHAYTVLACREVRGKRRVALRNPWGEDVKAPEKARSNGLLEIEFGAFLRLFQVVSTLR